MRRSRRETLRSLSHDTLMEDFEGPGFGTPPAGAFSLRTGGGQTALAGRVSYHPGC